MSFPPLHPNDPRLTAFALGELPSPEQAWVEAAIASDPELQAEVAAAIQLTQSIKASFQAEAVTSLNASQRNQILATAAAAQTIHKEMSSVAGAPGGPVLRKKSASRGRASWPALFSAAAAMLAVSWLTMTANRNSRPTSTGESFAFQSHQPLSESANGLGITPATPATLAIPATPETAEHFAKAPVVPPYSRWMAPAQLSDSSRRSLWGANGNTRWEFAAGAGTDRDFGLQDPLRRNAQVAMNFARPQRGRSRNTLGYQRDWSETQTRRLSSALPSSTAMIRLNEFEVPTDQFAQNHSFFYWDDHFGRVDGKTPPHVVRFGIPALASQPNLGEVNKKEREIRAKAIEEQLKQQQAELTKLVRKAAARRIQQQWNRRLGLPAEAIEAKGTEQYERITENDFIRPRGEAALSTFGIDVDTASYSNLRRFLNQNQLPPADAIRLEELINYFPYDYQQPTDGAPFSVNTEVTRCPWASQHYVFRVGLQGRDLAQEERQPSNIVFLVDVSGSMNKPNKLPLVQTGLGLLTSQLTKRDTVSIVTYAGRAGVPLPPTRGDLQGEISACIDSLTSGGGTNGAEGIKTAYQLAVDNFIEKGTNRVILCTDGDFNIGISSDDELIKLIQQQAKSGVFLSVFGFGMGNLKDAKLEKLADKGNGFYGYIDTKHEAKKLFVEELAGTLYTIAKDVKIQVEFNPRQVGAYRLLGYENRIMPARDFNDDKKDAGEIGAGHRVTALYEIVPPSVLPEEVKLDFKYQQPAQVQPGPNSPEMLTVKLRYKQPDGDKSTLIEVPVAAPETLVEQASLELDFQTSIAAFGMLLRNSKHKGTTNFELVKELALAAIGTDKQGYRREYYHLVMKAERLALGNGEPLVEQPPEQAEARASKQGRYRGLLAKLHCPEDQQVVGNEYTWGYWHGSRWKNHTDLPAAHWVYVYPHWYLWETDQPPAIAE